MLAKTNGGPIWGNDVPLSAAGRQRAEALPPLPLPDLHSPGIYEGQFHGSPKAREEGEGGGEGTRKQNDRPSANIKVERSGDGMGWRTKEAQDSYIKPID